MKIPNPKKQVAEKPELILPKLPELVPEFPFIKKYTVAPNPPLPDNK